MSALDLASKLAAALRARLARVPVGESLLQGEDDRLWGLTTLERFARKVGERGADGEPRQLPCPSDLRPRLADPVRRRAEVRWALEGEPTWPL